MSRKPLVPSERLGRSRREREAFLRRSLARRSQGRFCRDLAIVPHVFLALDGLRVAPLRQPREEVLRALRGQAVWTLDTAARLACGRGLVAARDLTGYLHPAALASAVDQGLIDPAKPAGISIDPLLDRPPHLVVHLVEEAPPHFELSSGDRVVTWDFLARDILGTLGWRPDLLARLEEIYPRNEARDLGGDQAAGPL